MGIELEDLNKKILELKGMHNALYNYIFEDVIDKARKTYMQKLTIEYMKRLSVTAKDLPNVHIFSQEKIIEDLCVNNKEKWKSFYNKFSVFLNSDRVELYNAINSLQLRSIYEEQLVELIKAKSENNQEIEALAQNIISELAFDDPIEILEMFGLFSIGKNVFVKTFSEFGILKSLRREMRKNHTVYPEIATEIIPPGPFCVWERYHCAPTHGAIKSRDVLKLPDTILSRR